MATETNTAHKYLTTRNFYHWLSLEERAEFDATFSDWEDRWPGTAISRATSDSREISASTENVSPGTSTDTTKTWLSNDPKADIPLSSARPPNLNPESISSGSDTASQVDSRFYDALEYPVPERRDSVISMSNLACMRDGNQGERSNGFDEFWTAGASPVLAKDYPSTGDLSCSFFDKKGSTALTASTTPPGAEHATEIMGNSFVSHFPTPLPRLDSRRKILKTPRTPSNRDAHSLVDDGTQGSISSSRSERHAESVRTRCSSSLFAHDSNYQSVPNPPAYPGVKGFGEPVSPSRNAPKRFLRRLVSLPRHLPKLNQWNPSRRLQARNPIFWTAKRTAGLQAAMENGYVI